MRNPCLVRIALALSGAVFTTALAAQKVKIKFDAPTAYDSGGPGAVSVVTADLRGIGKLDLVVANSCQGLDQYGYCTGNGEVVVLLGNGDGTFQPAITYSTEAYIAQSVVVGDVNHDGSPDLIVANDCQSLTQGACDGVGGLSVLLGNGDGTFQPAVTYSTGAYDALSVATGNLNGDGSLDLVSTNACEDADCETGSVSVLLGNGDGTFQAAVNYSSGAYWAYSVAIADVNGDGIPDLMAANWCERVGCQADGQAGVLLGNGDGTFQPAVTYDSGAHHAYSIAAGDLRGDGIVDLVITNGFTLNTAGVLLGNGNGTFQPVTTYVSDGWAYDAVTIGDVDGDGIPDLVVIDECQKVKGETCIGTGKVSVMLGNGDGTFQEPVAFGSGGSEGSAIAIADVNGDGRPDIVVTNLCPSSGCGDGLIAVLLNETSYSTKTALASSPNPSQLNQTVTFTATIASTPPISNGEVVTFYNGKTSLGTGKTTNGVASLTTSFSKAKTYTIKADYPGDPFHKKSSGTVKQVVSP